MVPQKLSNHVVGQNRSLGRGPSNKVAPQTFFQTMSLVKTAPLRMGQKNIWRHTNFQIMSLLNTALLRRVQKHIRCHRIVQSMFLLKTAPLRRGQNCVAPPVVSSKCSSRQTQGPQKWIQAAFTFLRWSSVQCPRLGPAVARHSVRQACPNTSGHSCWRMAAQCT